MTKTKVYELERELAQNIFGREEEGVKEREKNSELLNCNHVLYFDYPQEKFVVGFNKIRETKEKEDGKKFVKYRFADKCFSYSPLVIEWAEKKKTKEEFINFYERENDETMKILVQGKNLKLNEGKEKENEIKQEFEKSLEKLFLDIEEISKYPKNIPEHK